MARHAEMPRDADPRPPSNKTPIAVLIAAACAVAAPYIMKSEGLRTKPYLDPVKIQTVCYGETNIAMKVYSKDECGRLLRRRLARVYAPKVLECLPQLEDPRRRNEFAAMIDSSYNAGPGAVCKSQMAKLFRSGHWIAGCKALPGWYVTARDRRTGQRKVYAGLVKRRIEAMHLCLRPE